MRLSPPKTDSWHLRDDDLWMPGKPQRQLSQFVPYHESDREFVIESVLPALDESDLDSTFEELGTTVRRYLIDDGRLNEMAAASAVRFVVDGADNGIVVAYEGHIEVAGRTRQTRWEITELSSGELIQEPSAEARHPAWREIRTLDRFTKPYEALARLRIRENQWVTDADLINDEIDIYDIAVVDSLAAATAETPRFEFFGNDFIIAAPTGGSTWVCLLYSGSDDPSGSALLRYGMAEDVSGLGAPDQCKSFNTTDELAESMAG